MPNGLPRDHAAPEASGRCIKVPDRMASSPGSLRTATKAMVNGQLVQKPPDGYKSHGKQLPAEPREHKLVFIHSPSKGSATSNECESRSGLSSPHAQKPPGCYSHAACKAARRAPRTLSWPILSQGESLQGSDFESQIFPPAEAISIILRSGHGCFETAGDHIFPSPASTRQRTL